MEGTTEGDSSVVDYYTVLKGVLQVEYLGELINIAVFSVSYTHLTLPTKRIV